LRSRRTFQRWVVGGLLLLAVLLTPTSSARAGQLTVATCQSDHIGYSTQALVPDLTVGMRVHSACNPRSNGLQGVSLANVVRRGKVPYKAYAALKMTAPPGTQFTRFTWLGDGHRSDCGFAVQLWAQGPAVGKINIRNYLPGARCRGRIPPPNSGSATANVAGATMIIVRVQCWGSPRGSSCSARGSNYYRLKQAEAVVADPVPPSVSVDPLGIASAEWVAAGTVVRYEASDNVGVRSATAYKGGTAGGSDDTRPCTFAVPDGAFATMTPCPNGPGLIEVNVANLPEGSQPLVVTAQDVAGNTGSSPPVTVHIDHTPPARVNIAVDGGDAWRSSNDFSVAWANPPEPDRAPIDGAQYELCSVGGGECDTGAQGGDGLASLRVHVPGPGQWQLSLWRSDSAGNGSKSLASDPVMLRYDPEPPQATFESPSPSDPTLITVDATDDVSGVSAGTIEISQVGSGAWTALPTQLVGNRLTGRVDDAALPAGIYAVRAHVSDQAHNETVTQVRADGQAMTLSLPVRIVTGMQAAFQTEEVVTQRIRKHGRPASVRRHVTVMKPAIRATPGEAAQVLGRLTDAAGEGVAGQQLSVYASSSVNPEHAVGVVQTDAAGAFQYTAVASSSQTLRFAYEGSTLTLPSQVSVQIAVPAVTSLQVNRKHLRNGQTVRFSGVLRTNPAPAAGKLMELQVLLPKGWETFRTLRTDGAGRWMARYHFTRSYGVQRYRFRVRLPAEAGYPFSAGGSRAVEVIVRGRR
jgi:hypothetical protein